MYSFVWFVLVIAIMQPTTVIITDVHINFCPGMCLASIIVQQRNHAEDKLLLGCEDGTLVCEQF